MAFYVNQIPAHHTAYHQRPVTAVPAQSKSNLLSPNQWLHYQHHYQNQSHYQNQQKPSPIKEIKSNFVTPPRNKQRSARTSRHVSPHSYSPYSTVTPPATRTVSVSPAYSRGSAYSAVSPLRDIDAQAAAAAEIEATKLGICRFYGSAMGCQFGENCVHSHSDPNSVAFCRYFMRSGGCLLGTKCTFRHQEYAVYPDTKNTTTTDPMVSPLRSMKCPKVDQSIGATAKVYRHPIDAINRTDIGLAAYYTSCGRKDYYNAAGKGKFVEFVMRKKWNKRKLVESLGDRLRKKPSALWTEIDADFPSPRLVVVSDSKSDDESDGKMSDQKMENEIKCRVLRRCMVYGAKSCCVPLEMVDGGCYHLDRMLVALQFYATLDLNVEVDCDRFMRFMKQQYTALLYDFEHIVECHGDWKSMGKYVDRSRLDRLGTGCNVVNCLLIFRQKMDLDTLQYLEHGDGSNDELMFYRDLMDSMHCLLAHGCDIGIFSLSDWLLIGLRLFFADAFCEGMKIKIGGGPEVKAMKWKHPLYDYMSTVQCGKEQVAVFSTSWCMTRNHR